jgi:hypothetical protein
MKSRLLETHTLSHHEKLEILYKSEPLGGRKPSQMLASMLAYCLAGMEQTIMFQFLFLQRLPVTLRTLLGEQEPGDIWSLADRADRLWATHKLQSHDLVAQVGTVEEQPAQIVAVQVETSGPGGLTHSEQARVGSGLCYFHWTHGARARRCEAPCSWSASPERLNAVAPGFLVHEMDQFSGRRFLVDAGAISSSPSAVPGNRWGNFGAKGGVVPPSVFNQLLKCADQIHIILHYFTAYFYARNV